MKNTLTIMVLAALLIVPGAFAAKEPTIADIVADSAENGEFTILLAALQAEDNLIDRLERRGHVTVFAPTDAAFADLLAEQGLTAEQVLANKDLLRSILLYHVVPGDRDSTDVTTSVQMPTLKQEKIYVDGTVLTDQNGRDVNIVQPDVFASNGVIHVIDRVLLPTLA